MYHDSPHGTQISKDSIPHGTEHPHGTHDIPTCIMISPTVLNIPMVLKITPTVLMISPTVLNTPRYSRYPHIYHDIPHGTQDMPHGAQDIPHSTHDIPTVLSTPTVLHTHYTG